VGDNLKQPPWPSSQQNQPQAVFLPLQEEGQTFDDGKVTPPGEAITPPRVLPSRPGVLKSTGAILKRNKVIPPRLSLKQSGDVAKPSRKQFKKHRPIDTDQLFVPITERAGFSSDLIDTQEMVAVLIDRGETVHHDRPAFDKHDTLPTMALKGIASQQGEPPPVMQSQISGEASNAALIGAGNIAGNVLKYGNNLLIQRGFGAGPYGLYSLGMSMVTLFVSVFNLGLDDAMVRYVSIYRTKKQADLMRGLSIFCTLFSGLAGILGALLMLFFAPPLATIRRSPAVLPLLLMMAPLIPLMSMQGIWSSGLQGFKAFKSRILLQRLLVPGLLTLLLILVIIFFRGNIIAVVVAGFISTVFSAVLNLGFFSRMVSRFSSQGSRAYELRAWMGFAAPNFLTSVVDMVLEATDTLLLAFLVSSAEDLGRYAAANKISIFIAMPLITLNVTFAPTIAELFSKGEMQNLAAMFQVVTKWIITFSLPLCLIAMLFSQSLLAISGKSFVEGWPLLIALAVGSMLNAGTGPVGYMLLMTGHQKLSFINSIVAVVLNIVLGIFLTTRYGVVGTAVATGLALGIVNLMRLLQVRLLLKIHPYRPDTIKPILAGLITTLLFSVLLQLLSSVNPSIQLLSKNIPIQLSLVPVFLACYTGLLALFKVSPEDKIVLDKLRSKFGHSKKKKEA
jgi:O-antigen/teichoic acid export membrane protein